MRNALLVNPFSLNAGPRPSVIRNDTRFTPVCSRCQSDDLVCHAVAQWSNRSQQWELANTFEQPVHCNTCDSPCAVAWQPLNWRYAQTTQWFGGERSLCRIIARQPRKSLIS